MSADHSAPLIVHGWATFAHPLSDDWSQLLAETRAEGQRLRQVAAKVAAKVTP